MTEPTDPRIIAAMYNSNDDEPKQAVKEVVPQPSSTLTEGSIESHRNVNHIKLNKQLISVPSIRYVQEISKELTTVKNQARALSSENRQLKQVLRTLASEIKMLKMALDNKIDKL
jgi:RNA polymerase-interacting CarD/CdnL/TRCF family regulator